MPNNYGAIELGICENVSLALNEKLGVATGFKPSEWTENIDKLSLPTESDISFTSVVENSWDGTNSERDMLTLTALSDTVITFNQSATGSTNCSSNDGYVKITVNGVATWEREMPTNASQTFDDIPTINLNKGDVLKLVFGFANRHTNINMNFTGGKINIVGGASLRGVTGISKTTTTMI